MKYRVLRFVNCYLRRRTYRMASGRELTDRDIYRLADEAERGYEPGAFERR
jgi:hypothetical protein